MSKILKTSEWFPRDGFPVSVERREPQGSFPPHKHEFSEIVVVTGGKGLHVVGRETWPLTAGDVFVIGGPRSHAYEDLDNLKLINILFRPEKIQLGQGDLLLLPGYHAMFSLEPAWRRRHQFNSRLRLTARQLGVLVGCVEQLEAELRERSPGFAFMAQAFFMQLVGYLSRCYGQSKCADSRHLLRIARAMTHLEGCLTRPVNLDELAHLAGMSKRSFARAFHGATGMPPIAYLIQLRINRAAELLRSGTESITEVAFRVGFADSNYFTRQFRKLMGKSPRQHRQALEEL